MSAPSRPQHTNVPPEQKTTFPLETMTDRQREVFIQFIETRYDTQLNVWEPIWLALLLAGKKPATGITTLSVPDYLGEDRLRSTLTDEDVAEVFDLITYRWDTHLLLVARTSWRFDILPSENTISDAYHRRFGCFFGFPEDDVDGFLTAEEDPTLPNDLVAEGVFPPEEIAYESFIPQGKDDSIEGYERAIELGKAHRNTIAEYAEQWKLPELDTYAEQLYHDAVEACSIGAYS